MRPPAQYVGCIYGAELINYADCHGAAYLHRSVRCADDAAVLPFRETQVEQTCNSLVNTDGPVAGTWTRRISQRLHLRRTADQLLIPFDTKLPTRLTVAFSTKTWNSISSWLSKDISRHSPSSSDPPLMLTRFNWIHRNLFELAISRRMGWRNSFTYLESEQGSVDNANAQLAFYAENAGRSSRNAGRVVVNVNMIRIPAATFCSTLTNE